MTPEQRVGLGNTINLGGNPEDIDLMVKTFRSHNPSYESTIVHWLTLNVPGCDVKSEAQKVAEANIASAEYAKRGFNISVWALGIAILSLVVSAVLSVIALAK